MAAATQEPTPPNLGNLTPAQFLALPDWSVVATNQTAENGEPLPDTFAAMQLCVVALTYRLMRDNFAYENDAWGCNVSTPLLEKVLQLQGQLQARPTDNLGQALTLALLSSFAVTPPKMLFACNGSAVDEVGGQAELINIDPPGVPHVVYSVVNAQGSQGIGSTLVYGARTTLNRSYYTGSHTTTMQETDVLASCNVTLGWPEDSSAASKIVLLKVAMYDSTLETGAGTRMQFEFGLQAAPATDVAAHGTDRVLYLRWFDANDIEVIATARVNGESVSIGMGREITLGFLRVNNGQNLYNVSFFANGVLISTDLSLPEPSVGNDADIRLIVGSNQLGTGFVDGPINNVYYSGDPGVDLAAAELLLNSVYRIGAGYLRP